MMVAAVARTTIGTCAHIGARRKNGLSSADMRPGLATKSWPEHCPMLKAETDEPFAPVWFTMR
jgi:hypothetical protein